jgi:hypothetical protein
MKKAFPQVLTDGNKVRVKRNWKKDELDKELSVNRSKIDRGEIKRSRDSDIHKARSERSPEPDD